MESFMVCPRFLRLMEETSSAIGVVAAQHRIRPPRLGFVATAGGQRATPSIATKIGKG